MALIATAALQRLQEEEEKEGGGKGECRQTEKCKIQNHKGKSGDGLRQGQDAEEALNVPEVCYGYFSASRRSQTLINLNAGRKDCRITGMGKTTTGSVCSRGSSDGCASARLRAR
jgi:hypothetical protein